MAADPELDALFLDEPEDSELDDMNERAWAAGERGFYSRSMEGEIRWHEGPDRERCGGSGSMNCYCGGDFCCCANNGEIECVGCEDCDGDDDLEHHRDCACDECVGGYEEPEEPR